MRKSAILFAAFMLLPINAMATETPPTATSVLAAAKTASGGAAWGNIHSIRKVGTIRILGLKGPAQTLTDLKTGASVTHMKLSLGTMASGNDGKTSWVKDFGGEVLSKDLPAEHARALTGAYLNAMGYWHPKRWPATRKFLGTRSVKGRTYQVVQVTPKGGASAQLWFDSKTHLLARLVQETTVGTRVTTFSDYRSVDGLKISFESHSSYSNNNTWLHVRTIKVNVPTPIIAFAKPGQIFNDITFAHGATSATMPFKLIVGRLIDVPAAINGRPVQLMLDTGGTEIVTQAFAQLLKLKEEGNSKSHGWGKKAVETRWARVQALTLGGKVTLHHQVFRILPIENMFNKIEKISGEKISGLLGYQIFKRFVVRIDYTHKKLTLIKPDAFNPNDSGTAIPITFAGLLPAIKGSLDGLKGEFTIDTGMGVPLIMWTPFVKQYDLLSRYKVSSPIIADVGGIGGGLSARYATAGVFMLGPIAIHDPFVILTSSQQGALAFKDAAGNIGGAILNKFTVTFDYAHKRMYLKPNAEFNAHHFIALPAGSLAKFVGRYQIRPHVFVTIARADDQLSMQVTSQPALPIYPESKTDFYLKIADVQIDFVVNSANQVTGLIIHKSGHSVSAKRIN